MAEEKKYVCKYCGKQCKNGQILGGHMVVCKQNPKSKQSLNKSAKAHIRPRIQFVFNCKKCGKQYVVSITNNDYLKGRYSKYCSRSCANSHVVTEETRTKISKTLRKFNPITYQLHCILCGKPYTYIQKHKNSGINPYCSISCQQKIAQKKVNHTEKLKKAYKNGKSIGGGFTKWMQYKNIKVQGSYQYRTCVILDKWVELGMIQKWQYSPDRIKYIWEDGSQHYYIPDFKVFNKDNTWYYIQVKGYKKQLDQLKWRQTIQSGYNLVVWFAYNIKQNELKLIY